MRDKGSWPGSLAQVVNETSHRVYVLQLFIVCCNTCVACFCMYMHCATSCCCALTCFSSGSIHHCWCCTPCTITKCPCCNPVLSTGYCRADCNSPPSTCIHILSYHWYSKAGHLISSNQCIGYVIIMLSFVFHCCIYDFI